MCEHIIHGQLQLFAIECAEDFAKRVSDQYRKIVLTMLSTITT
jgi:hypothetical protein